MTASTASPDVPAPRGAAFLLLVDARLPTGGHAHSGGMEEAVASGTVRGVPDLPEWLRGRLTTVGLVDAAFAAAAHARAADSRAGDSRAGDSRAGDDGVAGGDHRDGWWAELASEWAARTVSPALRAAGRAQGRGLVRAARSCWPHPVLDGLAAALPDGAPWPLALGAAGFAAGCPVEQLTLVAAAAAVTAPAWATTRLLGTDPFRVGATLAGLAGVIDEVARDALRLTAGVPYRELPASSAPLLDLGAQHHADWEVRLFAS
jgi:urease accessory protein